MSVWMQDHDYSIAGNVLQSQAQVYSCQGDEVPGCFVYSTQICQDSTAFCVILPHDTSLYQEHMMVSIYYSAIKMMSSCTLDSTPLFAMALPASADIAHTLLILLLFCIIALDSTSLYILAPLSTAFYYCYSVRTGSEVLHTFRT